MVASVAELAMSTIKDIVSQLAAHLRESAYRKDDECNMVNNIYIYIYIYIYI
jgi:hypothetical protein